MSITDNSGGKFLSPLSPQVDELTTILTEELTETATELLNDAITLLNAVKTIQKTKRFGEDSKYLESDPSNKEQLSKELGDVFCIAERLIMLGLVDQQIILSQAMSKNARLDCWLRYCNIGKQP